MAVVIENTAIRFVQVQSSPHGERKGEGCTSKKTQ